MVFALEQKSDLITNVFFCWKSKLMKTIALIVLHCFCDFLANHFLKLLFLPFLNLKNFLSKSLKCHYEKLARVTQLENPDLLNEIRASNFRGQKKTIIYVLLRLLETNPESYTQQ